MGLSKKISVLFFMCLSMFAFSQELVVSVIDKELDFPLEGVRVYFSKDPSVVYYTDFDGLVTVPFPENSSAEVLCGALLGYTETRLRVLSDQKQITMFLSITEIIEGKELVVERKAIGKTDEKSGVSIVMDKRQMDTTSRIGILPDIMSSIKTLPGIIYSGMWSALPSVRGGYPEEMGTVLDGVYVLSPFHWGGSVSIFNPSMVESVKMSHGVFSTRYGRATSGLLNVSTVEPKSEQIRFDVSVSSISTDLFAQIPFDQKTALFIGGSVTYLDTIPVLYDLILYDLLKVTEVKIAEVVNSMPFIRDGYAKFSYKPFDRLSFGANVFFGSEGLSVGVDTSDGSVIGDVRVDWLDIQSFAALNMNWLATDNVQISVLGVYNLYRDSVIMSLYNKTTDPDFNSESTTTGEAQISGLTQLAQGKIESDIQLTQNHIIGFGVEEVFQTLTDTTKSDFSSVVKIGDDEKTDNNKEESSVKANNIITTAGFALWNFGNDASVLQGEVGLRGEHSVVWNSKTEYTLNTKPVFAPRFNVQWKVLENMAAIDNLTLSLGSGLFSQVSDKIPYITEEYGLKDFDITPNRTVFQVIGADISWMDSWNFKLEGYYKYYINRLFGVSTSDANFERSTILQSTGTGHITGFDFIIQKKAGLYFDGYISYSFVYARFMNTYDKTSGATVTDNGDPLNTWYFPNFHRFNSVNLVCNWRPIPEIVLTLNTSFATGVPKRAEIENGMKQYSDTLRTGSSYPVDFRFAYSNFIKATKLKWEVYFGIEDILGMLNKDSLVGNYLFGDEEPSLETVANFNFGLPIVSIGGKISL